MYSNIIGFISLSLIAFFFTCAPRLLTSGVGTKTPHVATHPLIIVDSHIDAPYSLHEKMEDVSLRISGGDFDYPRAKAGGLNVPFMSIFVPATFEGTGGGKQRAERLIQLVEKIASNSPDKFGVVYSVADVRKQVEQGIISLAMGMENGTPIEGNLDNLRYFYRRGIRYVTLAHSQNNHICDSSLDPERRWNGLSPFGIRVVGEMNRLGMMVDVSHVSDSTFYQVIRVTKAPVIASHSSCRYFTPGWERNMSDDMIFRLAKSGGVIQINFGTAFLKSQSYFDRDQSALQGTYEEHQPSSTDSFGTSNSQRYQREHPATYADVKDVADHIDHVVQLVGVDYVGIGSDFDGVGDTLPTGLKDVACYPNLIQELMKRGYSEEDIRKICGENLLRVWAQVEQIAKTLQAQ